MVREADVATVDSGALPVGLPVPGERFQRRPNAPGCAANAATLPDWMRGSSLESVRRTGGFGTLFVERFRHCVTGAPAAAGAIGARRGPA